MMDSMMKALTAGLATFAVAAALGGCSATKDAAKDTPATSAPTSTSASVAPAAAHNRSDVMFAHHMIPHHQQAVEMSDMILGKQGIDPRVVELATQIKAAQAPEIEQMQGWLTQWGTPMMPGMGGMPGMSGMPSTSAMPGHDGMHGSELPSATTTPAIPGMGGMGDMPMMSGMGMMSAAEMEALKNAEGVAASKLFLTGMITHHQGAITMAQDEIKNGQNADAIALSKSIIESQQKEIDTMNQILSTL